MDKIYEEHKLKTIVERCEEEHGTEHDSDSESEYDRDLCVDYLIVECLVWVLWDKIKINIRINVMW